MKPSSPIFLSGATGFVGSYILRELHSRGYKVHCLVRDPQKLPQQEGIVAFPGSITDPATIAPAIAGCSGAIHLVGIIAETKGQSFEKIHTQGTKNVVDAATSAGVTRYIHMSALGTRPNAASTYHQTKWAAEEYVRQSSLVWTIFRPGLIHGPGGEFTKMLRDWSLGKAPPFLFMPFFGQGLFGQKNSNLIQPVHIEDVAWLFVQALENDRSIRKTYELGGPERFTWRDFLTIASRAFRHGKPKFVMGIPAWLGKTVASLPLPLPFNKDQIQMSQESNAADNTKVLTDFPQLHLKDFRQTLQSYAWS